MSTKKPVDVCCVGYACTDISFHVSHHPGADEKLRATKMHTCGGGPAANAAVAAARLGGSIRFCGYLGKDAFGDAHLRELQENGVHTDVLYRGETATPLAVVTIKPNGERSIVDYRSASALVPEAMLSLSDYPAKVLLVDGHQPLLSLALVKEARTLGIPSVLDAGSVNDGTTLLHDKVDYLIASEKFARQHSQEENPRTALTALDGCATLIAVTWGSEGVYWQDENGQHHTPAFDIEAVDTTGAGDAFHGAFALGLAEGLNYKDNFRRASAVGALTCLKLGSRSALPTRKEVDALVLQNQI